jgi:hypothetical protein
MMLQELYRHLQRSDPDPGSMQDYVQYALVNTHGDTSEDNRIPVDLPAIRELGVEPVVLPVEKDPDNEPGVHDPELVAAVLLSLC